MRVCVCVRERERERERERILPTLWGPHEDSIYLLVYLTGTMQGKARQGKFICIAHFIHIGNSKCFT